MKIAIASGKGGTGKTTIATSLAYMAAREGRTVAYLDCDVEEPNGHIFLQPVIDAEQPIEKLVPQVDPARCTHCGRCARACRYGALASLPGETLVFAELCHACGGCALACESGAISEHRRTIGWLRAGRSGAIRFLDGVLRVGEAMSPPAIRAVKSALEPVELAILDAPPGTSCPAVEAVRGCDQVILVTEPTPFGLHDLGLAVEMVRALEVPFTVVINRADVGDARAREYCERHFIPLLAEIPESRAVAEAYSRGELACRAVPSLDGHIAAILSGLSGEVCR
ncbi:MAG: P-loop NTPase [Planctomycetota bacterium]